MTKQTIELSNQEKLAYQYLNGGFEDTVLLIHGNMSSGVHFDPLTQRLKATHNVLVPDLRGFGDSTYHTPIESLEDFADDMMMLINRLNIKQALHVVGWSTGGGIALKFAAKYPQYVNTISLIESCSYRGYPIFKKDAQMQPTNIVYESKDEMAKDPVQVLPAVNALKQQDKATMKTIWQYAIYNVNTPDEDTFELNINETLKQRNLIDVDWALMTFNMSTTQNLSVPGDGSIEEVKAPVLNLYGAQDLVITQAMFDETNAALHQVTPVKMPEWSHSPITDDPDKLAALINAHITS